MRRTILLLSLSGFVAPAAGAQEPSHLAQKWDSVITRLPANPRDAARILNETYARRGIPLLYWPKKGVPDSALRDLDVGEGPCGAVAFVQSPGIPPRDERLVGEVVAEIDSTGHVLRRWPVPVNSSPLRLRGNVLVVHLPVRDRTDLALAIREDGQHVVVPADETTRTEVVDCPPHRLFPNSAYARCLDFPDPSRGRRLLVYEAPCT